MSAHTPGDWGVFDPATRSNPTSERRILVTHPDGYRIIADCSAGYCSPSGGVITIAQRVANAHLIAAAPDLLAACDLAIFALESNGWSQDCPLTLKELRAAIAKAKGTS